VKKIGQLLNQKDLNKKKALDEKAIFYVFTKTIKELYGDKGIENIKPFLYKEGKVFIKSPSSNWINEIWLNKEEILEKINSQIGAEEIIDIKISHN
jgi:hypothetical protein